MAVILEKSHIDLILPIGYTCVPLLYLLTPQKFNYVILTHFVPKYHMTSGSFGLIFST